MVAFQMPPSFPSSRVGGWTCRHRRNYTAQVLTIALILGQRRTDPHVDPGEERLLGAPARSGVVIRAARSVHRR